MPASDGIADRSHQHGATSRPGLPRGVVNYGQETIGEWKRRRCRNCKRRMTDYPSGLCLSCIADPTVNPRPPQRAYGGRGNHSEESD